MNSRRKRIISLVVWNLVVWISAAHLSGSLRRRSLRLHQATNRLRLRRGAKSLDKRAWPVTPTF